MMKTGPMDVYPTALDSARRTAFQRMRAEKLGMVVLLNRHGARDLAYVMDRADCAISLGQIKFFFNDNGLVVGYVIWALVSEEMRSRLRENPAIKLHIGDYNEGDCLWILDIAAPFGHLKDIVLSAATTVFSGRAEFSYARFARMRLKSVDVRRS